MSQGRKLQEYHDFRVNDVLGALIPEQIVYSEIPTDTDGQKRETSIISQKLISEHGQWQNVFNNDVWGNREKHMPSFVCDISTSAF